MNNYQKDLIEEHSNLVIRIKVLHNNIYSSASDVDNKVEFANKCIQLAAMKKYEEALRARIENTGIMFNNGEYLERVATIASEDYTGSDFDVDTKENNEYSESNNK